MAEEKSSKVPPLVDLKVSNPVEYIKAWWKKVIANEGMDFRFHIHPLTAIAVAVVIASIGFGIGRFVIPFSIPFFKYEDVTTLPTPTPDPDDWKETAFTGTLQYSSTTSKYFLTTSSASEAISLQVPESINLKSLVGKRVLVIGNYNKKERIFIVADTKDMEVLSSSPAPIPTVTPTPTPSPTPEPSPTASPTETPSLSPTP